MKFGIDLLSKLRGIKSFVSIALVTAMFGLETLMISCVHFPYFVTDLSEIRYTRSPVNAVNEL